MAEVAGLVLGAVGIAGVIGVFKDTVEVFNLIADSRYLGRDYEILETKLDIEKTLLLMWAHRVRLLSCDYDKRLDDPVIQKLVIRMLECIAFLFADVPDITTRYGLDTSKNVEGSLNLISRSPRVSDSRWQDFLVDYQKLRSQNVVKNMPPPFLKKARWMIRDKTKFEKLVEELAHFTTKINEVVPVAMDDYYMQTLADEDVSTIRDLRKLKILKEASVGSSATITASAQHAIGEACKDRILSRLWFRRIDDRRESIKEAHHKTLQWALSPPTSDVPWDDLSAWLRSGSGVYWISGKAGSGKSTLMKHLYMDKRIGELLSRWAGRLGYTLCDYFFMNLGTMEQKSQGGLSRTLLYQILSANRNLIPQALPYMWKDIHDQKLNSTEDDITLPSSAEIKQAFDVIADSCNDISRFCFLIDGLDEFVGNYIDAIDFIKSLASNKHIKIIVSSRPIPSCVAAFANSPKLHLQDLSREDIASYVHDIIGSHGYMESLLRQDASGSEGLMKDIVDKSSGVFLWVVLACRSLLSGFDDHDSILELQHRVDELPPELEDMFQHMLNNVNKRHRAEGSRLLRFCYMHQVATWTADQAIKALGLAMVADYTSTRFVDRLFKDQGDDDRKEQLCKVLEGRLRSRCGGLLEVSYNMQANMSCLCKKVGMANHNLHIDAEVRFMHRTVFEFLNDEETWELECLHVPPNDVYNLATALSLYGLHLAIESLSPQSREGQAAEYFWRGLRWAVEADDHPHGDSEQFFKNLGFMVRHPEMPLLAWRDPSFQQLSSVFKTHPDHLALLLAIESGATNFVKGNPHLRPILSHDKYDRISCKCFPVLCYSMQKIILPHDFIISDISRHDGGNLPSRAMVKTLLEFGFDPNMPIEISALRTPWTVWIQQQERANYELTNLGKMQFLFLVEDLLLAGADANSYDWLLLSILSRYLNDKSSSEQVREKIRQILLLIQKLKT